MEEEIRQLNALLRHALDAEKGYRTAAGLVEDRERKAMLLGYSEQRSRFAYELKQLIRILGGDFSERTSVASSAHRLWINLKGRLGGAADEAILRECLRGEQGSVEYYEQTLNETTFSNDTRLLLSNQYQKIKQARRDLEEQADGIN